MEEEKTYLELSESNDPAAGLASRNRRRQPYSLLLTLMLVRREVITWSQAQSLVVRSRSLENAPIIWSVSLAAYGNRSLTLSPFLSVSENEMLSLLLAASRLLDA